MNHALALFFIMSCLTPLVAADGVTVPPGLDPKWAEDYAVQGEYAGTKPGTTDGAIGVQVLSNGDGTFRVVVHDGGLPGAGWSRGQPRHEGSGKLRQAPCTAGPWQVGWKDGAVTLASADAAVVPASLAKIQRASPTLGAKPPVGAVVLFDGSEASMANWRKGKIAMTADGLLPAGATTSASFAAFNLHLEFMLPYEPKGRGQGRGNSGCYLQGRYECQILDSFGLAGLHNECGGIYELAPPLVNMCFPPLAWQTYDIEFTPATFGSDGVKTAPALVTVRHNGVVIHDHFALSRATGGGGKEKGAPGPILLQDHGHPVRFRNIWLVKTDAAAKDKPAAE